MGLKSLPEKVRSSELAKALAKALEPPQSVDFDHWDQFSRLRKMVSEQVGEMKVLFPEFTPHDEEHHLARLFGIADRMLGAERYAKMKAAELFLLACGLYAHDWGMAVGRKELEYLRAGAIGEYDEDVFTPIEDEQKLLNEFVDEIGLRCLGDTEWPSLNDDHLRSYVRRTHAWRSGARARQFFQEAGSSVPQAIERICQGHWLEFADLDDDDRFPSAMGVLGEEVNLRAVAIYVRLIDLFDIADDRTPYAVWRFVAPEDHISKMEWDKHRALNPVTFPAYGDQGRTVRFDGNTSEPDVWAELSDLKNYCEQQLAGSMDLLARYHDERHSLDLRKISWKVAAERFQPVDIRFEFERHRMFQILSNEIYQGDSYVFLRELLQNSIDAVRLRKELVQSKSPGRRDVGLGFDDAIYFEVEHHDNGDATVVCRDEGVGMDEYSVRNYLAVAGRSYYQSNDFRHLGLEMDPISRFGVGILSCFMVANSIEIETCRDQRLTKDYRQLLIKIPDRTKQFHIFADSPRPEPGTEVTVNVKGSKLKADVLDKEEEAADDGPRLRVTEYLCAIAGFVDCPVVVDEDGIRTVILAPDRDPSEAEAFAIDDQVPAVHQLSQDYPWEEVFLPQDLHLAKEHLTARKFDLESDLGMEGMRGTLIFAVPQRSDVRNYSDHGSVSFRTAGETVRIRFHRGYEIGNRTGISKSAHSNALMKVHRNGLLVAEAKLSFPDTDSSFPLPAIYIDLCESKIAKLDISRRDFVKSHERLTQSLWTNLRKHLASTEHAEICEVTPVQRFDRVAELSGQFHMPISQIEALTSSDLLPRVVIRPGSGIQVVDNCELQQTFVKLPRELEHAALNSLGLLPNVSERTTLLDRWNGEEVLFYYRSTFEMYHAREFLVSSTKAITKIAEARETVFLQSPYPSLPPLTGTRYQFDEGKDKKAGSAAPESLWAELSDGASELSLIPQISFFTSLQRTQHRTIDFNALEEIIAASPFSKPYHRKLRHRGYEGKITINGLHPFIRSLKRAWVALVLAYEMGKLNPQRAGEATDIFSRVVRSLKFSNEPQKINEAHTSLWDLLETIGIMKSEDVTPLSPEDLQSNDNQGLLHYKKAFYLAASNERVRDLLLRYRRPFGMALAEINPDPVPPAFIEELTHIDNSNSDRHFPFRGII